MEASDSQFRQWCESGFNGEAVREPIDPKKLPKEWTEADWRDLHETREAFQRRLMERHR